MMIEGLGTEHDVCHDAQLMALQILVPTLEFYIQAHKTVTVFHLCLNCTSYVQCSSE